jgi:hypothetical protein
LLRTDDGNADAANRDRPAVEAPAE